MSDMKEHVKEVEKFEKSSLSSTDTVEKIILPDAGGNCICKKFSNIFENINGIFL